MRDEVDGGCARHAGRGRRCRAECSARLRWPKIRTGTSLFAKRLSARDLQQQRIVIHMKDVETVFPTLTGVQSFKLPILVRSGEHKFKSAFGEYRNPRNTHHWYELHVPGIRDLKLSPGDTVSFEKAAGRVWNASIKKLRGRGCSTKGGKKKEVGRKRTTRKSLKQEAEGKGRKQTKQVAKPNRRGRKRKAPENKGPGVTEQEPVSQCRKEPVVKRWPGLAVGTFLFKKQLSVRDVKQNDIVIPCYAFRERFPSLADVQRVSLPISVTYGKDKFDCTFSEYRNPRNTHHWYHLRVPGMMRQLGLKHGDVITFEIGRKSMWRIAVNGTSPPRASPTCIPRPFGFHHRNHENNENNNDVTHGSNDVTDGPNDVTHGSNDVTDGPNEVMHGSNDVNGIDLLGTPSVDDVLGVVQPGGEDSIHMNGSEDSRATDNQFVADYLASAESRKNGANVDFGWCVSDDLGGEVYGNQLVEIDTNLLWELRTVDPLPDLELMEEPVL